MKKVQSLIRKYDVAMLALPLTVQAGHDGRRWWWRRRGTQEVIVQRRARWRDNNSWWDLWSFVSFFLGAQVSDWLTSGKTDGSGWSWTLDLFDAEVFGLFHDLIRVTAKFLFDVVPWCFVNHNIARGRWPSFWCGGRRDPVLNLTYYGCADDGYRRVATVVIVSVAVLAKRMLLFCCWCWRRRQWRARSWSAMFRFYKTSCWWWNVNVMFGVQVFTNKCHVGTHKSTKFAYFVVLWSDSQMFGLKVEDLFETQFYLNQRVEKTNYFMKSTILLFSNYFIKRYFHNSILRIL